MTRRTDRVITFRVSEETAEAFNVAARKSGQSISGWLRSAGQRALRPRPTPPDLARTRFDQLGVVVLFPGGYQCQLGTDRAGNGFVGCCAVGDGHASPSEARDHGIARAVEAITANAVVDPKAWELSA